MGMIQIMSPSLANKIAAGEVVERPMSVVKELVENAIDAGSTKIDIALEQAGITLIKVTDNGSGMAKEDALLAFERHATSKLKSEADLFRIQSLGFRGEALPSIASVSDVTLITSTGEDLGTMIHYRGGKLMESANAPSKKGTEVAVRSLFFNTPARLKYLKSENTELSYTIDYINKMAIAHPDIAFKLQNNNRILLETYGNNNIIQVLANIYGLEVAKKTEVIEYQDSLFTLKLYYTTPDINRTTRNYITNIINKRYIRNNELTKAVLEGYETYLPINRYPIAVLDITVDPLLVDVNVHPAKLEVRLSNQEHIKSVITELIQKRLRDLMYVPKVTIREPFIEKKEINGRQEQFEFISSSAEKDDNISELFTKSEPLKEEPMVSEYKSKYESKELETEIRESTPSVVTKKLPKLYYIGQLLGTYLLAQNDEGLYLIDQHAAEERINFERYLKHLSKPINESYELLVPLTFDFSLAESLIIEQNISFIKEMGIELERFGLTSFIVTKIPNYVSKGDEKEILNTIFQYILTNKKPTNAEIFKDLAATLACKRSIKANHYINEYEIDKLLDNLERCENPYTCPHGRPVIIHITKHELEQMFKRTQ